MKYDAVIPQFGTKSRWGLDYYPSVLFETVPALYDELSDEFRETYGEELPATALPRVLRFGSWIGGDLDGNPLVTPECTQDALQIARRTILDYYIERVNQLIWQLGPSTHQVRVSMQLEAALNSYEASVSAPELNPESQRKRRGEDNDNLNYALAATINGIAAGLRNTGVSTFVRGVDQQ